MKHLITFLLILACGYSLKLRKDNITSFRSAAARAHEAKARELGAELQRLHADDSHINMAGECADFLKRESGAWVRMTDQYAQLSNVLILMTILHIGLTNFKKREERRT